MAHRLLKRIRHRNAGDDMRSDQYDYNDDPAPLPNPCYDGLPSPPGSNFPDASKRSAASFLAFGIAWLFGLEALLSDDET